MVAIKGTKIDSFLNVKQPNQTACLIYGSDEGNVREAVEKIISLYIDSKENLGYHRFKYDNINNNEGIIQSHLQSISMFDEQTLVHIFECNQINQEIKDVIDNPDYNQSFLIIEAGALTPQSALRKAFEKAKNAFTIACYTDDNRAISKLINEIIANFNLTINNDARNILISQLGANRLQSRSEIEKLCIFCMKKKKISSSDIFDITGDISELRLDELIDNIALGNIEKFSISFERLLQSGTNLSAIIITLTNHFLLILTLQSNIKKGNQISDAVNSAKPPIFFKRKPFITAQLSKWSIAKSQKALALIYETEKQTRLNSELANTLFTDMALRLCYMAKH